MKDRIKPLVPPNKNTHQLQIAFTNLVEGLNQPDHAKAVNQLTNLLLQASGIVVPALGENRHDRN
jgi:hypothetical protein